MTIQVPDGKGGLKNETISTRNGMNEITRLEYVKDCNVGVTRWNMAIKRAGVDFELSLPNTRFRRSVGAWAGMPTPTRRAIRSAKPSSTRARTSGCPTTPTRPSSTA